MDNREMSAPLEEAVRAACGPTRRTTTHAHLAAAPPVLAALDRERVRSQRHNHYFAVIIMSSTKLGTVDLLNTAAGVFRASDTLGLIDAEGRYVAVGGCGCALEDVDELVRHARVPAVAAVLPETDRSAAACALKRFESMLTGEDQVRVGLAVFPDDSTDCAELLRIAVG